MKRNILILLLLCGMPVFHLSAQILSLDSCKHYALEHNKQIKTAKMNVEAADEEIKNIRTNFFPKINVQAVTFRSSDYLLNIKTPQTDLSVYDGNLDNLGSATEYAYVPSLSIKTLDYLNTGMVTAIQPVYMGGKIRAGYKLGKVGKDISENQLSVSTEEFYWTLVSLNAKRRTLDSYEKMLNSLLGDVKVSYDAGLTEKSDLLKVEMQLSQIAANKLKLENGITITEMALCQHIGIDYHGHITLQDTTFTSVSPQSFFRQPDQAVKERTEYKLLNKAVDVEVLQKKLDRAEYLPQLSVGAIEQYLDVADQNNTFGLAFATLSIPISDWWGGSHKLKEQELKIDIAKTNREDKMEKLRLQIEKAYQQLTESYQQINVAGTTLKQAQEHLNVVTDNWKAGIMSTSDLLEAQAKYQESKDNLVDAQSTYQLRKTYYLQAIAALKY